MAIDPRYRETIYESDSPAEFAPVVVHYTGPRLNPMRFQVWVGGKLYNANGYVFGGQYNSQQMTLAEANVLTGTTAPVVVPESGEIVTGWLPLGDIPLSQLELETFEIVRQE